MFEPVGVAGGRGFEIDQELDAGNAALAIARVRGEGCRVGNQGVINCGVVQRCREAHGGRCVVVHDSDGSCRRRRIAGSVRGNDRERMGAVSHARGVPGGRVGCRFVRRDDLAIDPELDTGNAAVAARVRGEGRRRGN